MPQSPQQVGTRDPTADHHAATKAYVDQAISDADLGGGPIGDVEVGGTLTVIGAAKFNNVCELGTDPATALEAVTKRYADALVAGYAKLNGANFTGACTMPGLVVNAITGPSNAAVLGITPPNPADSSTLIATTAWVQALLLPLANRVSALETNVASLLSRVAALEAATPPA